MAAILVLACAGACLSVASSMEAPVEAGGRILLSCEGTLITAGETSASPIMTNGGVDLDRRWVYGFGLGGVPIVYVTQKEIGFASPTIDGSLDRHTGRTTITMHAGHDLSQAVMSMDLACRLSMPLS